jgi:hypothetical protein
VLGRVDVFVWRRTRIGQPGLAEAPENIDREVVGAEDLAREPHVGFQILLAGEARSLALGHLSGIALKYLNATSRALRETPASVQNIDSVALQLEDEATPRFGLECLDSNRFNRRHATTFPI